jgi:cysteinyl-tRNA synthetase
MNDDLNVPAAVAVAHARVTDGNTALTAGDMPAVADAVADVRAMLEVLGVDPGADQWSNAAAGEATRQRAALDSLIGDLLQRRADARAAKDFAAADAIRDSLAAAGIEVADTPSGPRWSVAGEF